MQYLISVIHDQASLASPDAATDLDVAHTLAAEGSNACNRKVEVRPFR